MARVQYGAMITNIKGSVGGFTFQSNASGTIVRKRPIQKKVPTQKQTIAQSLHATMVNLWQQLSVADREDWNDYAALYPKVNAFGQSKNLTGLNWFESINQVFTQLGISTVATPPAHLVPSGPPSFDLVITPSSITIEFDPAFEPTDEDLQIWTTQPVRQVTPALQNAYRLTTIVTGDNYGLIDLTSDWEAAHSIPWPPTSSIQCFTVGVMVRSCSRNSGICSVGTQNITGVDIPLGGIGVMIVGSTFQVA